MATYGEMQDGFCQTDTNVLQMPPISFSLDIVNENMTTGSCPDFRKRTRNNISAAEFFCENATLQCLMDLKDLSIVDLSTCRGVIQRGNPTFLPKEGATWPGMPYEMTEARLVRGIDFRAREWLDAMCTNQDAIDDAIHVVHGVMFLNRHIFSTASIFRENYSIWVFLLAVKIISVSLYQGFSISRTNPLWVLENLTNMLQLPGKY